MDTRPAPDPDAQGPRSGSRAGILGRVSPTWLLVYAAVWWVVAGEVRGQLLGAVLAIGGAALLHAALGGRSGWRLSFLGALRFVPFFLHAAFRGGLDVARRAFDPALPLAPKLLLYRTRLPEGAPRVLFVNSMNLMPGTFSAALDGAAVQVHLLASDYQGSAGVRELEARVAAVFGLELPPEEPAP